MISIRRATPDHAATLTEIAREAKRYWGYPENWINHWKSDVTISPEFVSQHQVYVAEVDGVICGFYALLVTEGTARLEHMWVLPSYAGAGVSKELFLNAMDRAASLRAVETHTKANTNTTRIYKSVEGRNTAETDSIRDDMSR